MRDVFKSYIITLNTIGPVYIGSGNTIGKKEYIILNNGDIAILDPAKMYKKVVDIKKAGEFESFMLNDIRDVKWWLQKNGLEVKDMEDCYKYLLKCGDSDTNQKKLQICECVKDPYYNPYVPGSSIKGMLRTVMMSAAIENNRNKYRAAGSWIKEESGRTGQRKGDKYFLSKPAMKVEELSFRTMNREGTGANDAVNDVCQGLVVGDSEPLGLRDLILCRKIDKHVEGGEKAFPILRESIRPGTKIRFRLTIDQDVFPYTIRDIEAAIAAFANNYNHCFIEKFHMDRIDGKSLYIGGGAGFVSKTFIYPLFGEKEGLDITQTVFERTVRNSDQHKHYKDRQYGVSPHTIKITSYGGRQLQFGLCRLEDIEEI